MRVLLIFLCCAISACTTNDPRDAQSVADDHQELLRLHAAGLKAHLDSDVEALLAAQADDFVLLNRGQVSSPSIAERRTFLGPYLTATKFEFYRDAVPPIVKISLDGSLAWVIAQVEARGVNESAQGRRPLEFAVAWIELYEKRNDRWIAIGNASTFK
jgi:hypothetical protein